MSKAIDPRRFSNPTRTIRRSRSRRRRKATVLGGDRKGGQEKLGEGLKRWRQILSRKKLEMEKRSRKQREKNFKRSLKKINDREKQPIKGLLPQNDGYWSVALNWDKPLPESSSRRACERVATRQSVHCPDLVVNLSAHRQQQQRVCSNNNDDKELKKEATVSLLEQSTEPASKRPGERAHEYQLQRRRDTSHLTCHNSITIQITCCTPSLYSSPFSRLKSRRVAPRHLRLPHFPSPHLSRTSPCSASTICSRSYRLPEPASS